jgi:uncharacterized protein YegL
VALVIDASTSMDDDNKLEAAKQAALAFLNQMDLSVDQAAIVAFSSTAWTVQGLTQSQAVARTAIEGLDTVSGTDIADGLQEGIRILGGAAHRPSATAAIVLLSDGQSDWAEAEQAATQAREQGIVVYTVSLGSGADRALMEALASFPSIYHHAPTTTELSDIYRTIQTQIASAMAANIVVHAKVNTDAWELIPQSLSPPGIVAGDQITWTAGTLAAGQTQALTARVRAIQVGESAVLLTTEVHYDLCGDQPHSLTPGPGPTLLVLAPPTPTPTPTPVSPCTQEPLGNDCLSSLVCLGGLTWPCTILELPWWVCLLIPFLLLVALLLWLWWRREEQARRAWQLPRGGTVAPPALDTGTWQPFPTPSTPPLLPVTAAQISTRMNPTLVIGLGQMGCGAINVLRTTLEEAYGKVPSQIRLLSIYPVQGPPEQDNTRLILSLDPETVREALRQVNDRPDLQTWFSPETKNALHSWLSGSSDGMASASPSQLISRALGRLSLFVHRRELEARLQSELEALNGESPTIYLIGSLAEGYASGSLLDVAHLTRLQAEGLTLSNYTFQGLVMLPEAHTGRSERSDEQARLQQIASAAWRELDRFQSAFEHAYPLNYGDRQTRRGGKLLDRCYLFSPDRSEGPGLAGRPLTETLYPAIADLIVALADNSLRPVWERVTQAVIERTNRQQHQRGEALYGSLGSFTYVLPVEDLVQSSALQLAREMVAAQLAGGLSNAHDIVLELLSQPASPGGISGTALMQDVAQRADIPLEQAKTQIAALGVEIASLLSPSRDDEAKRETVTTLHNLVSDHVIRAARTSAEALADEYGPDTERFLDDVAQARELVSLDLYLEASLAGQEAIFLRILSERMLEVLNPPHRSDDSGLMAGLDLTQALSAVLTDNRQMVTEVADDIARTLSDVEAKAQSVRLAVQEEAANSQAAHPRLGKALLTGIAPAAAVVVGLGLATLAVPTLLLPLGGVALVATGVGAWGTWHLLHRTPTLIRQQLAYREAAQAVLALEVEHRLYDAWLQTVDRWLGIVHTTAAPLRDWHTVWTSSTLSEALDSQEATLAKRRQTRQSILVRRYLDDDQVQESLYQRHVAPVVRTDEYNRFVWSYNLEDDSPRWALTMVGTHGQAINEADAKDACHALLDIGSAYASGLRALPIADVLTELYAPETVAQECGPGSAPLIRMAANEQPLSESHRFVAVAGGNQAAYFDQVIQALRQPAAQVHSEQWATLEHPHRCATLASLDLLRNTGLFSWNQARRSYGNLPSRHRVELQIFPAERTAAHYEGLLSQIGLAWRVFSPQTVLTLENERRARTFWLAYAHGWVQQVLAEHGDMSSLRQMALVLPEAEPVPLTKPREEAPSLWQAVVAFVLGERGGDVEVVEAALSDQEPLDRQARRDQIRALERVLDEARRWPQA